MSATALIQKIYRVILISFVSILTSCSTGSSNSSNINYSLGTLPNGSVVYVTQSTFVVESNGVTTGTLGISGGSAGQNFTFSFTIERIAAWKLSFDG